MYTNILAMKFNKDILIFIQMVILQLIKMQPLQNGYIFPNSIKE